MQSSGVIGYPSISDNYRIGKLPPIRKTMERRLCVGRVWIFLVLGVILIVLGLVSAGVYFNIDGITSSSKYTQILPMYINSASIITAGVSVCLLFWRRLKVLVFLCVVVCVASGFLCGLTAVLTSTHILKPLQYFTLCRHYESQQLCQCFSPYKRDILSLEFSETEETKYDFEDTSSCSAIEKVLPQLLYTLVAVYSLVFLISVGSAIIALLVLRTERIKRGFFRDEAYEEVYTVSGSSSQDQSDSEVEIATEVNPNPIGEIPSVTKNSLSRTNNILFETAILSNAGKSRSVTPQNINQNPITDTPSINRAKTLDELGKESLATRYRITKTPDNDIGGVVHQRNSKTPDRDPMFNIRQRLSKTPDREISSRRRSSFSGVKRLSRSCDSLDSSGRGSNERLQGFDVNCKEGKKKGKLKEHRRKGKRAATVHNLDTDQLLLILNLQMRYLQETKEQQLKSQRRAITPQPTSQRPVIPQKVRSHTPQPYKGRNPNSQLPQVPTQGWSGQGFGNCAGRKSNIRSGSDSSSRSGERYVEGSRAGELTNDSANDSDSYSGTIERKPILIPSKSASNTAPLKRKGYNPYMQENPNYRGSVDQMHYVTYSDSMLNSQAPKPKSRQSVQNYFLPPEPLHRGSHQQLPPQPISRQRSGDRPLPPQPIHRGSSAFHIVDRNSKSRSPSVASDRVPDTSDKKARRQGNRDYADEAIRENFQLNSRQFILNDIARKNGNSQAHGNFVTDQTAVAGQQPHQGYPTDDLPPYSGPPSYKEYVSSCDNSVTSSLSSNPEEIYSFPKRRIRKDQKVMGYVENEQNCVNSSVPENMNHNMEVYENENVYGNTWSVQGKHHSGRERNVLGMQRPQGHKEAALRNEAIYSSPSRSRVKQCIVPENYYTALHKSSQPCNYGDRKVTQGQAKNTSLPVNTGKHQSEYTNVNNIQQGYYEFNPRIPHQIAPDAKYHEYEDVYDTLDSVPVTTPPSASRDTQSYTISTQGFPTVTPKSKSKPKSPRKQKSPYPVSNVNARIPDYTGVETNPVNCQVTKSVQNVHAENMQNIPRIKLNDVDADDVVDDEVFVDSRAGNLSVISQGSHVNNYDEGKSQVCVEDVATVAITHRQACPNEQLINKTSNICDPETDTGYMKMSLPVKHAPVCTVPPQTNEEAFSNHMTADQTNGKVDISHVTSSVTNGEADIDQVTSGYRYLPEGVEVETQDVRDQADYEETGV